MIDYSLENNNTKLVIKGDEWPEEILETYKDDIKTLEILGDHRELKEMIFCSNLETVILGPNVKRIDHGVFWGTTKLKEINLENVEIVDIGAFIFCSSLINNDSFINLIESKTEENAMKNQKDIFFEDDSGLLTITSDTWPIICFRGNKKIKEVIITGNLTKIPEEAFWDCSGLKKIVLPATVKKIEDGAFLGCKKLKEIDLSSITKLGKRAFNSCSNLQKVTLSNDLNNIPESCFAGCKKLIDLDASHIENIGYEAFSGCQNIGTFKINENIVIDYDFIRGNYIDGNLESPLQSCILPEGPTILRTGAFGQYNDFECIYIPNSIKIIEDKIAYRKKTLRKIEMAPDSVVEIGNQAFFMCENLEDVIFSDCIEKIGTKAFARCNLKTINLKDSVIELGNEVFSHNEELSVSLDKKTQIIRLLEINNTIFNDCPGIDNVLNEMTEEESKEAKEAVHIFIDKAKQISNLETLVDFLNDEFVIDNFYGLFHEEGFLEKFCNDFGLSENEFINCFNLLVDNREIIYSNKEYLQIFRNYDISLYEFKTIFNGSEDVYDVLIKFRRNERYYLDSLYRASSDSDILNIHRRKITEYFDLIEQRLRNGIYLVGSQKRYKDEFKQEILALWVTGTVSKPELARRYGLTEDTIKDFVKAYNKKQKNPEPHERREKHTYDEETKLKLIVDYLHGLGGPKTLGLKYDVSEAAAEQWIKSNPICDEFKELKKSFMGSFSLDGMPDFSDPDVNPFAFVTLEDLKYGRVGNDLYREELFDDPESETITASNGYVKIIEEDEDDLDDFFDEDDDFDIDEDDFDDTDLDLDDEDFDDDEF